MGGGVLRISRPDCKLYYTPEKKKWVAVGFGAFFCRRNAFGAFAIAAKSSPPLAAATPRMATQSQRIPTSAADYLEQDPEIRGQKYVCLSFVSPEDVIKAKEAFLFERFVKGVSKEVDALWNTMYKVYKDNTDLVDSLRKVQEKHDFLFDEEKVSEAFRFFKSTHGEALEREYLEKNNFQTTVRGIKVRGSYDTLREAEIRAQVLKRIDSAHNVYVAQVGCWCPWSPNPDDIENQEFAETSLNTLMHGYLKNQELKDEFYESRKGTLREAAEQANAIKRKRLVEQMGHEARGDDAGAGGSDRVLASVEADDPWMAKKLAEGKDGGGAKEEEATVDILKQA